MFASFQAFLDGPVDMQIVYGSTTNTELDHSLEEESFGMSGSKHRKNAESPFDRLYHQGMTKKVTDERIRQF